MANRILWWPEAGQLRVSKPGVDVLTADEFGLIFAEYAAGLIPGIIGEVSIQGQDVVVPLPDAGRMPIIYLQNRLVYADGTTGLLARQNPFDAVNAERTALTISKTSGNYQVRYAIFRNRQF